MKLLLKNTKAFVENKFIDTDILVENEKIVRIEKNISSDAKVIDCSGKYVIPGLIDAHVHFREPGSVDKEDFLSGSKAAAAGGVTTVLDMPNNTPAIVSDSDLDNKRKLAEKSIINYGLYVLGCRENMDYLDKFENIAGIKIFLGSSTGNYLVDDIALFEEIVKKVRDDQTIVVHGENEQLLKEFEEKFRETKMHHKIRDRSCALKGCMDAVEITKKHDKRLHIAHVSTKEEIEFLRKNKTSNITSEVCPHHLF